MIQGAYEVYLSGGYFVYYYANTAWDLVKPDPEPPGMARFQILKENLSTLPYWLMEPKPELAAGGPCLAIPGEVYAYLVQPLPRFPRTDAPAAAAANSRPKSTVSHAREIVVNLNALRGPAVGRWVNIWSGEKAEQPIAGPGVYQLIRPASFGAAPALLVIRARQ